MEHWSNGKLAGVIGLTLSVLVTLITIVGLLNPQTELQRTVARYADIPVEAFCGFLSSMAVFSVLAYIVLLLVRRSPAKTTDSQNTTVEPQQKEPNDQDDNRPPPTRNKSG